MSAAKQPRDRRRFRLAGNDNETIVADELDTEAHRLAGNDNETIVTDDVDTEAHRLASNDNETTVRAARHLDADVTDETAAGGRGAARR